MLQLHNGMKLHFFFFFLIRLGIILWLEFVKEMMKHHSLHVVLNVASVLLLGWFVSFVAIHVSNHVSLVELKLGMFQHPSSLRTMDRVLSEINRDYFECHSVLYSDSAGNLMINPSVLPKERLQLRWLWFQ